MLAAERPAGYTTTLKFLQIMLEKGLVTRDESLRTHVYEAAVAEGRAQRSATADLMGRLFGVRDIGLGVLAFYAVKHPETAPFLFLFNAFMDLGDLFAVTIPLAKRQGIDRGAVMSGLFAMLGGLSWLTMWLIAR